MAGSRATHIEIEFFGNGFEHLRFRNSLRKLNVISSALVACVYWSVGWIGWLIVTAHSLLLLFGCAKQQRSFLSQQLRYIPN